MQFESTDGESTRLTITLASPPDRNKLVAELWVGDSQLAEVSRENGAPILEIYPNPAGGPWRIKLEDLKVSLNQAEKSLSEP
jgi:hypothetical protein